MTNTQSSPASVPVSDGSESARIGPLTPAERMRHAAYLLRTGTPVPVSFDRLADILAAVLEQEAVWAEDRRDRYPDEAAVLALGDAVRAGEPDVI